MHARELRETGPQLTACPLCHTLSQGGWGRLNSMLESLRRDLRFSLRQLRKTPGFTMTAILVLALGMCASLAIFAFVDAALIKPLPYRDQARLVGVYERTKVFPWSNLSYLDYLDWKKRNVVFASLDVYQSNGFTLTTPAGGEPVRGARISDGFFRTLGVSPVLGRDFREGEDLLSAVPTALISYSSWQQRYGGNRNVLGRVAMPRGTSGRLRERSLNGTSSRWQGLDPTRPVTTLRTAWSATRRRSSGARQPPIPWVDRLP